jgi:hypothetical protein
LNYSVSPGEREWRARWIDLVTMII